MNRESDTGNPLDFSARLWFCLLAIIALVGVTLYWRGFDFWTVILICIALICPAVIIWGLGVLRRGNSGPGKHAKKSERDRL